MTERDAQAGQAGGCARLGAHFSPPRLTASTSQRIVRIRRFAGQGISARGDGVVGTPLRMLSFPCFRTTTHVRPVPPDRSPATAWPRPVAKTPRSGMSMLGAPLRALSCTPARFRSGRMAPPCSFFPQRDCNRRAPAMPRKPRPSSVSDAGSGAGSTEKASTLPCGSSSAAGNEQ